MIGHVITIADNPLSQEAANQCIDSWYKHVNDDKTSIVKSNAVTPEDVNLTMSLLKLKWNYPWDKPETDIRSGLVKSPYSTRVKDARIACAVSHYKLWKKCVDINEPIIIMEHDCEWRNNFDPKIVLESNYNIVGLNSPMKATRKAYQFHKTVEDSNCNDICPVPDIDDFNIPQGLAGNSCYYINPTGARALLDAVMYYGLWPNDAIMCKQLIPKMGVTKKYYSAVQGLPSTTT